MQSIDENTNIDDSLVTCAEYQLFIDEMREQGKYYQPDHWTSYQFPEGKAREPLLGVRYSDAVAFCEWLTARADGEQHYRLSTLEEGEKYSLQPISQTPLGHWLDESMGLFTWIGSTPLNPRNINYKNLSISRAFDFSGIWTRVFDHALDMDFCLVLARTLAHDYDHAFSLLLDRAINRNLHIDHDPALASARDFVRALSLARDQDSEDALYIYIDIFTLGERLAGRSPAFEGIRLVKERIK
jgi:hypothetical protein